MLLHKSKVHFIGIGGIGMSGIAQLLLAQGGRVSGSDLKASALTKKLQVLGAQIVMGHYPANIQDAELVVYSSAIKKNNPELWAAYTLGIPVLARAEALAILAEQKKSIAISGAHGKTTTSSLTSHLLVNSGLKPTICVGGELLNLNGNAFLGESDYFVLEADESDGSFLKFAPLYSVITNIDREHLDYYSDFAEIKETFRKFISNTKKDGWIIFCDDDPSLREIVHSLNKPFISYGLSPKAQIFAQGLALQSNQSRFSCSYEGDTLGEITLRIPGRHNVSNALAVVAVGLKIGLDFKLIQQALGSYSGVRRRLELKLKDKDILVFDDYAHHPTEIKATLEALTNFPHKRILAVFQPHRYTRTKFLIDDFGSCFRACDQLIVTDIYPASEAQLEGVTARNICQKAQEAEVKTVAFLPKEEILPHLLREIRAGDLVAIMGAGDIGSIADALVKEIKGAGAL